MSRWSSKPLKEFCVGIEDRCGERNLPVFSVSKNLGILPQAERFKKRIASADTSRYKVVRPGDFAFDPMLLWSGSISRHTSKRIGIVSPAYCVFRLINGLNPRFLYLYLTHPGRLPFYDSISFGTNERRRKAQFSDFAKLEIPVPPITEQERIVKLLDEADELRKLRAQADRRTATLIPASFHKMFGDPSNNSRGWKLTAICEMAEVQGGLQVTSLRDAYPQRRPYLRVANVQRGFLILDVIKEIGLLDSEYDRVKLAKGDLLLVEGNGNPNEVGRAAIWDGSIEDCVHQNHLIRVRPSTDLLTSDYLLAFVNSESGRSYFQGSGNTTSGLVTISTSIVKNCRIPLPPLTLQKEFAARVTEIRAMQVEQATSRRRLDDLFQSMLHRAFQGEL